MVRDPLYRKIEERLGSKLAPALFERCAVELLHDVYPGLAPVTGGGDAGMDGAIPNAIGEPLPLIVTTARDVIGNLTRSLKSYRDAKRSATGAVVATSQPLTPQRRRNLEDRAKEWGFTLRNIHDRDYFTRRLYRNSEWRLELLGLSGAPPALSALPRSSGPYRSGKLVGRDDELDRLRRHRGDALLVGQPGVGKTALLETLAREELGLFAVSEDPGAIADAFRDTPVRFIFLDDAHLREPLLDLLIRLREEPGFDFGIVASTWPSGRETLTRRLYLTPDAVVRVTGLSRDQVVRIVRSEHPQLPPLVLGEILDQSQDPPGDIRRIRGSCRPGLAMTLARHTARLGLEELVRGRLLLDGLRREAGLSPEGLDYLATLAIGGRAGMRLGAAARALGQPEVILRGALEALSGTGTLTETRGRALVVQPAALRDALVARTYFSGVLGLSPEPAMAEVEDAVACTETVIGALARGGTVPHRLIRDRLRGHREAGVGNRLLDAYTETGREGARWVLEAYPDRASATAGNALKYASEWALNRLVPLALEESGIGDIGSEIETWVRAGLPGADAVDRRRLLLRALAVLQETDGDSPEARAKLVSSCFSLEFFRSRADAIHDETFTLAMSSLTASDVAQLARFWPSAMELLRDLGDAGILSAQRIIRHWAVGVRTPGREPETIKASRSEVGGMLALALDAWGAEPGFRHWARALVREHALDVNLPLGGGESVLSQLFPGLAQRLTEDPQARSFAAAARRFAEQWQCDEPGAVADRMLRLERQGKLSGHSGTRPLDLIAIQLAEIVDEPATWLAAFAERRAPPVWVGSFLAVSVEEDLSGDAPWRALDRLDPERKYGWESLQVGLRLRDPPAVAVGLVTAAAREYARALRDGAFWSDVSDAWRLRLLDNSDPAVRGGTAAALWDLYERKRPPGRIGAAWEDAVVTCGEAELLHDVLMTDKGAALAWLLHEAGESARRKDEIEKRAEELLTQRSHLDETAWADTVGVLLRESETLYSLDTELLAAAVNVIGADDRRSLLQDIPADADPKFFEYLVGGDRDLYAALLGRRVPPEAHLAPLRSEPPSANRDELARLAVERGYTAADTTAN